MIAGLMTIGTVASRATRGIMADSHTPSSVEPASSPPPARRSWLRRTLNLSRQEAAASAATTAASDNFLNAFAVHLQASLVQMSWLTALPQLIGAWMQLISIWLDRFFPRRQLVVATALLQGAAVVAIALLAAGWLPGSVVMLIGLAALYHTALNLNQPHWRAWLGSIVPPRRRGAYFAGRTRLTMLVSVLVFVGGGGLLALAEASAVAGLGFALLFGVAACGRLAAAGLIAKMHDPDAAPGHLPPAAVAGTLQRIRESLRDPVFRDYSLFVAGMQGMVAISAPFFAVYMLRDLGFSYFEYALNSVASIATQFLMLRFWGRCADRYGNRLVMRLTSAVLPALPLLWLVSPNFHYLLAVQVLSGIAWSGFTLSTANYLYDIRPHQTNFATYAAVQAGISASCVFVGALVGGAAAANATTLIALMPAALAFSHEVFLMFALSGLLRLAVALWFLPRAREPQLRSRPRLRAVVLRVVRFNSVSGVVMDWLTVGRREARPSDRN